jgi:hypothetical protein
MDDKLTQEEIDHLTQSIKVGEDALSTGGNLEAERIKIKKHILL